MNIKGIRQIRYLPRYKKVINVLIRHGFGFLFEHIDIPYIKKNKHFANAEIQAIPMPVRLRYVLEELGPTYIKLGQILSTRPDLLEPAYIKELEKLQNDVQEITIEEVYKQCKDNGIIIQDIFSSFNQEPVAAASIAQVHQACLKNGERVVVKVQRPGIRKIIEQDLQILFDLSIIVEKRTNLGKVHQLSKIVEELANAIRKELDFELEGKNADTFRVNFRNNKDVLIPKIHWEYSNKKILVMEYIWGIKVNQRDELISAGINIKNIANSLIDILFQQIYEHGFFHADPHPGNVAVSSDQKIVFYDFGQIGKIDDILKEKSMNLIMGMARHDVNGVARSLLELGIQNEYIKREQLRKDVAKLLGKYYGLPLSEMKIGEALAELISLSAIYNVRIPAELSLMIKMLMTLESIISKLDPNISIVDIAEPYGRKIMMKRYSYQELKTNFLQLGNDYYTLFKMFPAEFESLLNIIKEGQLKIKMEHGNLEKVSAKFDIMSNRISLAIIVASIIIGSSLVIDKTSNILTRIPLVEVGFITAIILGLFLAYSIIKSGKY